MLIQVHVGMRAFDRPIAASLDRPIGLRVQV
jgi:hypothetical protein